MRRLWSPWRSEYVSNDETAETGCILCRFAAEDRDEENLIALRADSCFVMLNRFPYNSGHLMVVPYQHAADLRSLPASTLQELLALTTRCISALETAFRPDGYNAGFNLGSAAGAGIADHLHQHLVPRWEGDTNFMATLGDVKVLPERLQDSYRKLVDALATEGDGGSGG